MIGLKMISGQHCYIKPLHYEANTSSREVVSELIGRKNLETALVLENILTRERRPYTVDERALYRSRTQWAQKLSEYLACSTPGLDRSNYEFELNTMAMVRAYFNISAQVS